MFNKITIVGCGYVGLSMGLLLSQNYEIKMLDTNKKKIKHINARKSPIDDSLAQTFLRKKDLNILGTTSKKVAFENCNLAILCLPTNFIEEEGEFDTSIIEKCINDILDIKKDACIIIKSTVPIGFTDKIRKKTGHSKIYFSPEFLREGRALIDNLKPSRIIMGGHDKHAKNFAKMLEAASYKKRVKKIFMSSSEAESVKLFSNSYLAMRVSFFNELDNFSESNNLNSKNIIDGISADRRIGNFYNNPSFGFGGYCLPKDTKQLKSNIQGTPSKLISTINESNEDRKNFIAKKILSKNVKTIGVYKLAMKKDSDNFRESAVLDIIERIQNKAKIFIYDNTLNTKIFMGHRVISCFEEFVDLSDIIVANRIETELESCKSKVYTRDIFNYD